MLLNALVFGTVALLAQLSLLSSSAFNNNNRRHATRKDFVLDKLKSFWFDKKGVKYDFIVVGAGSAGSVIASRLSEVRKWKVLLLEAGKIEGAMNSIPILAPALQFTEYDWHYLMEYQTLFGMGMVNQQISWPRGKGLGGGSLIDSMIYSRGNPFDYDLWEALGNPGWSYQKVLPYFIKSENSTLRHPNWYYHGTGGYLTVSDAYQPALLDAFVEAGGELGYTKYLDYNSNQQFGFSPVQGTIDLGRRHTVARAFLEPAEYRDNLKIVTEALVTRILVDKKTLKAYGVEYTKKGQKCKAYATKEVILSAGAVNSPQLLMLSGIGPKYHLQKLGIPNLVDLPVGENLYDHIAYFGLNFVPKAKSLGLNPLKLLDPIQLREYIETGRGPLACLGGPIGIAFKRSNSTRPLVQLTLMANSFASDYGLVMRKTHRIRDDVYNAYWGARLTKKRPFTILVVLLHPKSSGHVKLRSRDPFVAPLLYGNYLTDPDGDDLKTLIDGIRFATKLSYTKAFGEFGIKLDETLVPGCEGYLYGSDAYWECAIRTFSYTNHDQIGTNKMGRREDPESVVDHELKVYGIKGLRVADASVIPVTLGAHIKAPVVMIGEKVSDLIKKTWYIP